MSGNANSWQGRMVAHLRADVAALLVAAVLVACAAGAEAAGTNFCDVQGEFDYGHVVLDETWYGILQCPRLQLFSRSLARACVPSDAHDILFWEDNCTKMSP